MSALNTTVWVKGEDGVNAVAFGPESKEIPDWALEQIGEHAFEGGEKPKAKEKKKSKDKGKSKSQDGGDPPPPDEDNVVPYAKRLKADLIAEVESRNEGRDDADQVVVEGNGTVKDLAAALEADDKAQAES